MKVILAIVTSINGKSTKGNLSPHSWASNEDQTQLKNFISESDVIVMGGNTFSEGKEFIKPSDKRLKVVLTKTPEKFSAYEVKGQLEFRDENPKQFVEDLKDSGHKQLLVLSGASLNTLFFREKLIDELWLTIEPLIFGEGKGIIDSLDLETKLKLISMEKLNDQGTLLLKYQVE